MNQVKPIKLLDPIMINQIAAGEVVERPASVVKELVENSIDAGATVITVEVSEGIIRVSDNGFGIPSEQVKTAFLRHATSKIASISDLEKVLTMGFRGEAMAAISAVSHVELVTKHQNEHMGSLIQINGGQVVKHQPVGAARGTSVIVRDLFHNVPARLKFLKKPATEAGYITDHLEKFVLANPQITFNYILNSKKRVLGGKGLEHAIYQIYGKDYYKDLLPVDQKSNNGELGLTGYIGKPTLYRSNRSFGNIFINMRYIKSKLIQKAIEEAYQTKLPIGQFPIYALNVTLNPRIVDVNVHPTKLEVRFQHEAVIYDFVKDAIHQLLQGDVMIPQPQLVAQQKAGMAYVKQQKPKVVLEASEPVSAMKPVASDVDRAFFDQALFDEYVSDIDFGDLLSADVVAEEVNIEIKQVALEEVPEGSLEKALPEEVQLEEVQMNRLFSNYKIVGTFFNTYVAIEDAGQLFWLDQHAAHERIWYDKLLQQVQAHEPVSQGLVVPTGVNLTPVEEAFFLEHRDQFKKMGFEVEEIGQGAWAIRAVPFVFEKGINPTAFVQMLGELREMGAAVYDNAKLASIACKAAVKGGDKLSMGELTSLIDQLQQTTSPYTCPHGRPTMIKFTKYEIEKMFKRVQ